MTKDELYRVRKAGLAIKAKRLEAAFLREIAGNGTGSFLAANSSGTRQRSKVESAAVELVTLEEEIDEQVNSFLGDRQRAAAEIAALRSIEERVVMQMRYLACRKWEDIAEDMGYRDVRQVYRIHGRALHKMSLNVSKQE